MFDEKEYQRQYRIKHKKKLKRYHKNWRAEHPEKEKGYAKKYRETHGEELAAKQRAERRGPNAPAKRSQTRAYRESSFRTFISQRVYDLKKRKHHGKCSSKYDTEITIDYLVSLWEKQQGRCALTGKKMIHKHNSPYTVSVDRIDSSVGYYEGNVQLVCQSVNLAKNGYSNEEFLYFWRHDEPLV